MPYRVTQYDLPPSIPAEDQLALFAKLRKMERGTSEYDELHMRLYEGNVRFAAAVASKYNPSRVHSSEDLFGYSCIGLNRAIKDFDPSRGCKFSSYAVWWCKQAVTEALSAPAAPVSINSRLRIECKSKTHILEGEDPVLDKVRAAMFSCASLDAPITHSDGARGTLMDMIEEEDPDAEMREFVKHLMGLLNGPERTLLKRRYGLGESAPMHATEIAALMGKNAEWVRKRIREALETLKKRFENERR